MSTEVNVKTDQPKPVSIIRTKKVQDRVPWQRITLSLLGIGIIAGMWRWSTYHLYVLPEYSIQSYASMTNNAMYAIAALVVFFVSGKMLYDWKNSSTTQIVDEARHVFEKKEEKIDQTITLRTEGGAKAFAEDEA